MSRALASAMLAAIQAGSLKPILIYEGQFRNTGTLLVEYMRLWSGVGDLSWDSNTWNGAGNLLNVSGIEESSENKSIGFSVSLNGLVMDNVAIALTADYSKNLPGKIWLGGLDSSGAVITDPYLSREGRLNNVDIDDSGPRVNIKASYEDENVGLLKPYNRRMTPEDLALDDPDDLGFEYVAGLQDKVIQLP